MVKDLDCGIVVNEFELQSDYYVHFRAGTLGKEWTPYPPSYGLNNTSAILLGGRLWHSITHERWYAIKQRNQTKSWSAFLMESSNSFWILCPLLSLTLKYSEIFVLDLPVWMPITIACHFLISGRVDCVMVLLSSCIVSNWL